MIRDLNLGEHISQSNISHSDLADLCVD